MLNQQSLIKPNSIDDRGTVLSNNNNEKPNTTEQINQQSKDLVDLNKMDEPLSKNENQTFPQNENKEITKSLGYGGLFIDCRPWADVYINGEKISTTPLQGPIRLPAGDYTLKLANPNYPPYPPQLISIKPDSVTRYNINLNSTVGFVNCDAIPWGEIYINGERLGPTPLRLKKVNPGLIQILIKKPNYKDIDTFYNVRAGDTLKLNFTFKKK